MRYLVAGLGNIGEKYRNTRHNIGFDLLDFIARKESFQFGSGRYGMVAKHRIKNRLFFYIKPSTMMNLSGNAVRYWLNYLKLDEEQLMVVVDDIAIPFGSIRIRKKGGDGGHNGLSHIIQQLGTGEFPRLRFGIGNDFPQGRQVDYVLSGWSEDQQKELDGRLGLAYDALKSWAFEGIEMAMTRYNKS